MVQLLILCAEPWVWHNTMTLSVVHQNSTWLMTMPSDLLLVQRNVRYAAMWLIKHIYSYKSTFRFFRSESHTHQEWALFLRVLSGRLRNVARNLFKGLHQIHNITVRCYNCLNRSEYVRTYKWMLTYETDYQSMTLSFFNDSNSHFHFLVKLRVSCCFTCPQ